MTLTPTLTVTEHTLNLYENVSSVNNLGPKTTCENKHILGQKNVTETVCFAPTTVSRYHSSKRCELPSQHWDKRKYTTCA